MSFKGSVIIVLVSLNILCQTLPKLLTMVVSTFLALYSYQFIKCSQSGIFSGLSKSERSLTSLAVGVALLMLQSCQDRQEQARQEQVLIILREALFFFLLLILVDLLKLTLNQKESELRMKNLEQPLSVGAGMAHAYFSYLKTVVNGREDCPGHSEALAAYLESECICSDEDDPEALWVSKKVYVFFATDTNIQLGIQDVRKMEKRQNNENIQRELKRGRVPLMRQDSFYLILEQLTSTYTASGQARPTNVFFLKMENNHTKGMNYAVFVENRPLKSLEYMVQDPQIQFDERDFKLQANLHYKELSKLVNSSNLRSRVQLIMFNSPGEKVFYHTVWRTIQEEKKLLVKE